MTRAPLSEAVPMDVIKRVFPDARSQVVASDVKSFLANGTDISSTCMFIWDEMVHRGVAKEPFKIAPIIHDDFKGIHQFIKKEFGRAPITDAYSVKLFNGHGGDAFGEVVLTEIYPDDIHISDVMFADNRKPVKAHRRYKGLHVFGEFLARLKEVAESRGKERNSLLCASPPVYEVFSRHGFKVSETEMAQRAFNMAGTGFAMVLKV